MFNQNFSFGSAPSPPLSDPDVHDCTSADISPFTSRPCSPLSRSRATQRDTRFDAYRSSEAAPRRPSVTAITAQLQSQALNDVVMDSPPLSPDEFPSSSSSSDTDPDEGFYDGPETPDTPLSDDAFAVHEFDPTLWDLSMSDTMVATSSPRPSLSLEAQALSSYTMRRRQRQALVRLQCLATRTPDLAMLIEECHPSSLPYESEILRAYCSKDRSASVCSQSATSSIPSGRVDKERNSSLVSVRKTPRMRKRLSTTGSTR
ncbi:hypothetical protein PV10_01171 [Exophiala mesophila]|uniref:Uncharacterized protein n=1 Tax=Exophiala mesophila TaxID=212818 RepID=A0A0D1Y9W0_EXOME|nr:uncharacterized protein PV10_01171 [Exophiala mesophila]KIV97416.1 hypothetical protein PV10_01171 [Exophiala mesophila]